MVKDTGERTGVEALTERVLRLERRMAELEAAAASGGATRARTVEARPDRVRERKRHEVSVGDRIIVDQGAGRRVGVITQLRHADGSPPYVVRWLDTERESLFFPGVSTRVEPASRVPSARRAPPRERLSAGHGESADGEAGARGEG
ncbi:DUF1918 domain-containing protein [Nocardiopsis sp. EMB25]|uniref:DUF1918 domain-containing protein n=1 Tax=Nocardiopsis sp. EMB25 TaxID=2835867 RepID=UPI002283F4AA|nr:DUF1918 domain-containing protein [Nocardiopsis sp. EMB25]MCY9783437.1 DUF1918 domain-containing protein [Nocardiopsis sp. EMB25]